MKKLPLLLLGAAGLGVVAYLYRDHIRQAFTDLSVTAMGRLLDSEVVQGYLEGIVCVNDAAIYDPEGTRGA